MGVTLVGCAAGTDAVTPAGVPASRGGVDRIGVVAPSLADAHWVVPPPTPLSDRVRLIRFWTDTCPFCRASAPALAELDRKYRDAGLSVVGIHHPKPRGTPSDDAAIAEVVRGWGWEFAVATDDDWSLLEAYWLSSGERDYTSVSFLIDRTGKIRFVHPGPEFHRDGPADHAQCRDDYADLEAAIAALLSEQP